METLTLSDLLLGPEGARAIVENLRQLKSLGIGSNSIGGAGACAIAEKLSLLTHLDVEANSLGNAAVLDLSRHLTRLVYLGLSENKAIDDASPLASLPALSRLDLSNTGVSDLSPFVRQIEAGVSVFSTEYTADPGINVLECPLKYPPVEVVAQGPEAVRNYFREIAAQGTDRLYEAKVLILGEGGAGKTSLLRRLYEPQRPLPAEDETTRGIDIQRHEFQAANGRLFRLNVWDFGGQQIYHATHQFFLTQSSLYILVDDTRTNDKSIHDKTFKFWLEAVETLTDASPLLIFQNEKGGRSKAVDEAGIKGRFPNFMRVYRGNLESSDAANGIKNAIEHFVQELPHVGKEVPAKWIAIRAALEQEAKTRPFISLEEYFEIYGRHLEFDRAKALLLSGYLHNLGVFLHFQDDPLLGRRVILQNQWATEAVFRILDDEIVKTQLGRFNRADCARLWRDSRYSEMDVELRALMEKFELCYPLADGGERAWLAPQLLSPSKPPALGKWPAAADLVVGYRYGFLPKGLVNRLMVRLHRLVKHLDWAWADGAFFEHDGSQALVEATAKGNEIELRARGPEAKALLTVLCSDLEALNDSFKGLRGKVEKWVPCVCAKCRGDLAPEMYDYAQLTRRKRDGKRTIECRKSYDDVSVLELLEGLRLDQLPAWASASRRRSASDAECDEPERRTGDVAARTVRIFLASSEELKADRDEFEIHFHRQNDRLRREGVYLKITRWEHFLEAMSDTRLQDEYNRAVRDCDVFVSLFWTKTGKYTEEEFNVAYQQFKRTGKPRIYTYFKQTPVPPTPPNLENLKTLEAFQKKLEGLGHFGTKYDHAEHLKRLFGEQIDMLLGQGKI